MDVIDLENDLPDDLMSLLPWPATTDNNDIYTNETPTFGPGSDGLLVTNQLVHQNTKNLVANSSLSGNGLLNKVNETTTGASDQMVPIAISNHLPHNLQNELLMTTKAVTTMLNDNSLLSFGQPSHAHTNVTGLPSANNTSQTADLLANGRTTGRNTGFYSYSSGAPNNGASQTNAVTLQQRKVAVVKPSRFSTSSTAANANLNMIGGNGQFTGAQIQNVSSLQMQSPSKATAAGTSAQTNHPVFASTSNVLSQTAVQRISGITPDPEKGSPILRHLVLLLHHAHECQKKECQANEDSKECALPHCKSMKNILKHMVSCTTGKNCLIPHCSFAKETTSHWNHCARSDCPVCLPIKQTDTARNNASASIVNATDSTKLAENMNQQTLFAQNVTPPTINVGTESTLAAGTNQQNVVCPKQNPTTKEWHQKMNPELRNHIVNKLIQAMLPTKLVTLTDTIDNDKITKNLEPYARIVECEIYERANSKSEYYHLVAEKYYKIYKELDERRKKQEKQQQQSKFTQHPQQSSTSQPMQLPTQQQSQQPTKLYRVPSNQYKSTQLMTQLKDLLTPSPELPIPNNIYPTARITPTRTSFNTTNSSFTSPFLNSHQLQQQQQTWPVGGLSQTSNVFAYPQFPSFNQLIPHPQQTYHQSLPGMSYPVYLGYEIEGNNFVQVATVSSTVKRGVGNDADGGPLGKKGKLDSLDRSLWIVNFVSYFLEEYGSADLPPVLKEFVDTGGLILSGHSLPTVNPTNYLRMVSSAYDRPSCHYNDPSSAKSDVNYQNTMGGGGGSCTITSAAKQTLQSSKTSTGSSVIPPHSLVAFGQFLKLPNYAEWLIGDLKQGQCMLRSGGGDKADFNTASDPTKSLILNSLPTLPFEILRYLFKSTPNTTEDGVALRLSAMQQGAIHVVLECLAVFAHQSNATSSTYQSTAKNDSSLTTDSKNQHGTVMSALKRCFSKVNRKKFEDKSYQYWAKGTGFGTGSTIQSWNVDQALSRQRFEDEHVTIFLQILACYINPDYKLQDRPLDCLDEICNNDEDDSETDRTLLPTLFVELIESSCLLSALTSYLRNDSVLDMAKRIPLYKSILVLLRVMAVDSQMGKFLLPTDRSARSSAAEGNETSANDQTISLIESLHKMKQCVDTYSSRLRKNPVVNEIGLNAFLSIEDEEGGEGLTTLLPDIQATSEIVEVMTVKIISKTNSYNENQLPIANVLVESDEEMYLRIMKKLQFDTYDMISEDANFVGGFKFNISYNFEQTVRSNGDNMHPARMKRLAQEAVTLSTSLPLSYSSSVFVRCDTDRLDVMKVLMTGPAETPYANGCFEFDVYFPPNYPNSPMKINLETTGRNTVRFNPNLYNSGKVCLSVLNTWLGRPEEQWNAQVSSFLQVLVSIQSLILVPEPYFNEPGYERSRGKAMGNRSSKKYNANIMRATVKWAMLDQIRNPTPCFKEIIHTHFWLKRNEIMNQISNWINEIECEGGDGSKPSKSKTVSQGSTILERHFNMLWDELSKLPPPPGLQE